MLETARRYLRYTSWPIIAAMLALITIGVLAVYVSESADPASVAMRGMTGRQIRFACVGLFGFLCITFVPYQRVGRLAYVLFAGTLVLLVALAVARVIGHSSFLLPAWRNSHRWISVGIFRLQPSELAKLTFIILLAWYLQYGDNYRRLRGLIVPFVLTLVPMALIFIQPDLGTSLLFLPTLYFMLFMAGAKMRHLLGIIVVATVLVLLPVPRKLTPRARPGGEGMSPAEIADRKALAYWTIEWGGTEYAVCPALLARMKHHQVRRIDGWLRQWDSGAARDKGFQLFLSKMVLGSGRLTGWGNNKDADTLFEKLPEDPTDFIFSVIGGRWGLLGCLALLGLYGVIILFGVEIAVITYDPFARLLAVGVLGLLFSQVFINVGMTMGLMPITGMTLPFVSYGGSSLVVNCAALGLLVNVGQRRPILLGKRPFEHGPKKEKPPAPYGPLAQ